MQRRAPNALNTNIAPTDEADAPPTPQTVVLLATYAWELAREELQAAETQTDRIKAANNVIRSITPEDMQSLSQSMDPGERRVARMSCEFIGAEDTSWSGAQKWLLKGQQFKKELLGMEGVAFMTNRMLGRLDEFGNLNPLEFEDKNRAAFALSLFMTTCIAISKDSEDSKGIDPTVPTPSSKGMRPAWPIKVDYLDVARAVKDAARWGKTALVICNGHAEKIDEYFQSRSSTLIDAKAVMSDERSIDDVRMALNHRIRESLLDGRPIQIAMSNTAVPFRDKYCADGVLPKAIFNNRSLTHPPEYMKILRYSCQHMEDIQGMDRLLCYSFVTTDLDMEDARDQLSEALPYFEEMAIVEVDPATVQY